ncbi:DUF5081 family protein [Sporolactobacillus shoreae]|uniref:DUF5081 family protein n=1 Tax=Sporolactobacillus shoreae TaxID=1465501 RepID=A0A4Z0GST4_9BACL|nr:DUF5081 family protein [Sporolactobacillus shoreae]TGA99997.1 DUF5081 family protein [Sporolactobacillus shoreae]
MSAEPLKIDGFSPAELYVLGTAVNIIDLFGLPESQQLGMLDDEIFIKAKRSLQEKGLLTDSGALTDAAGLLIEMLEVYAQSPAYVRINQQMVAFRKEESKDLIVLTEQQKWQSYRLEVLPKSLFIVQLIQAHPLLNRQPTEAEHKFLLQRLTDEEEKKWEAVRVDQTDLLALEWMPREDAGYLRPYSYSFYIPIEDELYRTDIRSQQTRKASLYYLYKELFNGLHIPYGQEAHAG